MHEIELVQLRRFVAVVEANSFMEAAQRLHITQQALSASIARMEEAAVAADEVVDGASPPLVTSSVLSLSPRLPRSDDRPSSSLLRFLSRS